MKNLVYLLFLFIFPGSSFTYYQPVNTALIKASVSPLTLEIKTQQPHTAYSNDGALSVSVKGGTAPYTLQIVSTDSPSMVFKQEKIALKKIGVGTYMIMVQDANKKVVQKTIELTPVQ